MTISKKLRISQRNHIFQILVNSGLDNCIHKFEWVEAQVNSSLVSKLEYKLTDRIYYFTFIPPYVYPIRSSGHTSWKIEAYPNEKNHKYSFSYKAWTSVSNAFTRWAQLIREDLTAIDYWSYLPTVQQTFNFEPSSNDHQPFTESEKQQIRISLTRARENVKTEFEPTPSQMDSINERFDTLEEKLDQLNRFDWKSLFAGTIVSVAVDLALNTQAAAWLFRVVKTAIMGVQYLLSD